MESDSPYYELIKVEMAKIGIKEMNENAVHQMDGLCQRYNKTPEELTECWTAFISRRGLEEDATEPSLELLTQMEKDDLNRKTNLHTKKKKPSRPPIAMEIDQESNDNNNKLSHKEFASELMKSHTEMTLSNNFSLPKISTSSSFHSRSQKGETVTSFGVPVSDWSTSRPSSISSVMAEVECRLHPGCTLTDPYLHMFSKLRDRCNVLSALIDDFAEGQNITKEVEEDNEEDNHIWDAVNIPSTRELNVVGRICCDANIGKLNASSILLEGSRSTSSGCNVSLDVSHLEKYSLFPGQIICGQGLNPTGTKLVLKKLYPDSFLPFPDTSCIDFGNAPLDIVVAAGPFTATDNNLYQPLDALREYLAKSEPHFCILIGPFADDKKKPILGSSGFKKLFEQEIQHLSELKTKTQFVIVASQKDMNCECVYPTPPHRNPCVSNSIILNKSPGQVDPSAMASTIAAHDASNDDDSSSKRFLFAPDPALIQIGGVVFGVTATDILFHLVKEEICNPPQEDRFGRICDHLLSQRSFYPLYPPAAEDMYLDFEAFQMHARMNVTPHVLVLPSTHKGFIKDVKGCLCVNPERLTKGSHAAGTFTRLRITPLPPIDSSYDHLQRQQSGSIVKHISAEIVRI